MSWPRRFCAFFPEAKLTIGPVVEEGFYYDIDMAPLSEDDFPKIEAEMKKIVKAKIPIRRRKWPKAEALDFMPTNPTSLK